MSTKPRFCSARLEARNNALELLKSVLCSGGTRDCRGDFELTLNR